VGRIPLVVIATGTTLLVLAALTLYVRDTGTFVPPPDKVAEGLIRQLSTHRARQTRQLVSSNARATLSADRLAAWFHELTTVTGEIHTIRGKGAINVDDTADAHVVARGTDRSALIGVRLVREQGLWKVVELLVLELDPAR
jgi:hypothetical protein